MSLRCPRSECAAGISAPDSKPGIRFGSYLRKSDSRFITRFRCRHCRRTFSRATGTPCFGQNRRRLNEPLRQLLCSGVSQRRSAVLLGTTRRTVARKLRFLADQARASHREDLAELARCPLRPKELQFDEMETFEHTKCKPLSIALLVTQERKILGFTVSRMPANGPLAVIARKKYGFRPDQRGQGLRRLFQETAPAVEPKATFTSDQNPRYPQALARAHPNSRHVAVKGRRPASVGQGELKRIGFDPLFALNHTAAMARANMNRLFRKTWCTTKKIEGLEDHFALYVQHHNEFLT